MKFYYIAAAALLSLTSAAQTKDRLKTVIEDTDVTTLRSLREQFQSEYLEREARIQDFLRRNPGTPRRTEVNGVTREIYDVQSGTTPSYFETLNANSARTSRANLLYSGGTLGLDIQGQGMTGFVWDGGSARSTHVEFPNNKVAVVDGGTMNEHATHVMGTIVAEGITNSNVRGLAFNASGFSYDWTNDYAEMTAEAEMGMLVSNQSYWVGTTMAEWVFGAYDTRARQFDLIAAAAPYYLGVTAAGNDRNDFGDSVIGPYLATKFGYNLLRGMQNAKNFLTVGAVSQVLNYTGPENVNMAEFSSWGPTDDGRIKPDVVAKGVQVRSTLDSSDTATGFMSGTSMASPSVAGSALLLQQYYETLHDATFMRAATVKGLIMHTADEAGISDGPDYEFGWGLVNTANAALAIKGDNEGTAVVDELTLSPGGSFSTTISSSGTTPLMVSISWTDPAASANNGSIDPPTMYLRNDLDVRVTKTGDTYFPWTLNPADVAAAAVRTGDNFRDNFEKIQIDNPSGTYTITVTHKGGSLVGGAQAFSLIATGPSLSLSTEAVAKTAFSIYPNPSTGIVNIDNLEVNGKPVTIGVFDIQGRLVREAKSSEVHTAIDISDLSKGMYIVKCDSGERSATQKIILAQ